MRFIISLILSLLPAIAAAQTCTRVQILGTGRVPQNQIVDVADPTLFSFFPHSTHHFPLYVDEDMFLSVTHIHFSVRNFHTLPGMEFLFGGFVGGMTDLSGVTISEADPTIHFDPALFYGGPVLTYARFKNSSPDGDMIVSYIFQGWLTSGSSDISQCH